MNTRSKASTGQEQPERRPHPASMPQPEAVARDGVQDLLAQFVERLGEAKTAPGVHQLQNQVSELAGSLAPDSDAFNSELFNSELLNAGRTQSAGEAARREYMSTARSWDNGAAAVREEADGNWPRDWFEQRFSELKQLVASNAQTDAAGRLSAVERRLEEISGRLDAMRKSPAQVEALQLVERQMRILANHLNESRSWQRSTDQSIGALGGKVDTVAQIAGQAAAMVRDSARHNEAAITVAAEKSAMRASDLTARRMATGLQQAMPAARFAVIEQEIRALSQHARETGQRSAKALEDVQRTLRQFLQHPPAQQQVRRAGIGEPIYETARAAAPYPAGRPVQQPPRQAEVRPQAPVPPRAPRDAGLTSRLEAAGRQGVQGASTARSPYTSADDGAYPARLAGHHAPQAVPSQAFPAQAFPVPAFQGNADIEFPDSGQQLKSGLMVAAIILLMASAGMLYLNLTAKKPGIHAPAAMSMNMDSGSAMAVINFVEAAGEETGYAPSEVKCQIDLAAAGYGATGGLTTISKTPGTAKYWTSGAQPVAQLQALAEQNDPVAAYHLGVAYELGRGIAKNLTLAEFWYTRAAAGGNVLAMHNLGSLSAARGAKHRPRDYRVAAGWFQKAAQHGLADSQYNLGLILDRGLGTTPIPVEAYKWYALAAASGDKEAERRRTALRLRLTREQLKRAEGMVAGWKPLPSTGNAGRPGDEA